MAYDDEKYRDYLQSQEGNYEPVFWSGSVNDENGNSIDGEKNARDICEAHNNDVCLKDEEGQAILDENGEQTYSEDNKPWKTNEMMMDESGVDRPGEITEAGDTPELQDWHSSSQAFAEESSGQAHLVEGDNTSYDSTFNSVEKQAIRENDKLDNNVDQVDAHTGQSTGEETPKADLGAVEQKGSGYGWGDKDLGKPEQSEDNSYGE